MTIEDSDAAGTTTYDGIVYFFCSKACKEKFDRHPDAYISGMEA